MKTIYIECNMGAAGDMLMAALLELHSNPQDFLRRLNEVGIPGVKVSAQPSVKCGITGTHISVEVNGQEEDELYEHLHQGHHHHDHEHEHHDLDYEHEHDHHGHDEYHDHDEHDDHEPHSHAHEHHEHAHNSYEGIEHLIAHLKLSKAVKENVLAVYHLIAEAESHVHGVPVTQIHFHEVGEMDAVADIVGVCMLMEELAPDRILASPVNVGSGQVRCAHGILPVPAPATTYILQNVPMYSDQTKGELCTPTGAALLKHFVKEFCQMPVIRVTGTRYGMGKKDFEKANCVRVFMGEIPGAREEVLELICNLDDMTPEAAAFAEQRLFEEGALDVYLTPIGMKKGRQGFSLTCMCRTDDREKMLSLIFLHTTTLGIREYVSRRYTLEKEQGEVQTRFGTVRVKTSHGFGVTKSKPEYEDVARIARENGISIQDVLKELT